MIKPALENNLSAGTDVAVIDKKSFAIKDKFGKISSCLDHHCSISSSLCARLVFK